MNYTNKVIAEVKKILEIESNYKLSKITRIPEHRLSSYKTGKQALSIDDAVVLAEIKNEKVEKLIVELAIEKCKDGKNSLKLKKISETMAISYITISTSNIILDNFQCILCYISNNEYIKKNKVKVIKNKADNHVLEGIK